MLYEKKEIKEEKKKVNVASIQSQSQAWINEGAPHENKMAGKEQFPMVIGRILFNMGAKLPEHPNDTSERVT
jgi:hypothetical protein